MPFVALITQLGTVFSFWNLLLVCATLLYVFWWRRPYARFPPGPRGLPFVGVLPFLGRYPAPVLKKWSLEKYGPVMSIRLGRQDVVILNTFDVVNQALVKQGSAFSDRPYMEMFCSLTGHGGVGARKYGDIYKQQKQFGLKFLREKGNGRMKMDELVNQEGDFFVECMKQHGTGPFNLKEKVYLMASNIITKLLIGKRMEYDDPKFLKLVHAISLIWADPETSVRTNAVNQFNFLAKVPWFKSAWDKLEDRMQVIIDFGESYIKPHKDKFNPSSVDNFIDAFFYEAEFGNEQNKHLYTDEQLKVYLRDLYLGGSESISSQWAWMFVYLMHYPEHYKIIEKEVDETLGLAGIPTMASREKMPFTCAFIQELSRLKTAAPLAVPHEMSATAELTGFVIPKGTTVIANLHGVHMDPQTWPKPEVFDPHRHMSESGKFVPSSKVIPFSVGPRFCIGESLGRMMQFIIFVKIIQHFRIEPADRLPRLDKELFTVVVAPSECMVRATPKC